MRDIREKKKVYPNLGNLACMEIPRWCHFEEHKYGRRQPTETSVFEFPKNARIHSLRLK